MKEKKFIKIPLKLLIVVALVLFIVLLILLLLLNNKNPNENTDDLSYFVSTKKYDDRTYYVFKNSYNKDYDLQFANVLDIYPELNRTEIKNLLNRNFVKRTVMKFDEYSQYCKDWNIKQKYSDKSKNYIIFAYWVGSSSVDADLAYVDYNNDRATLYIWDESYHGLTDDISSYVIVVPTDNNVKNVKVQAVYNDLYVPTPTVDKPIIYLYPENEIEATIELGFPNNITCSYPLYNNKTFWNVKAFPNGNLVDLSSGRSLYSLYYEATNNTNFKVENDGFIVKSEDTAKFLEDKLEILGLNEREAEEFIIYWLPKLNANKYNYIRFATLDEINENMPLNITPSPNTLIRILMVFKGLDEPISVNEQPLECVKRNGFTVVEWGGCEI